MDTFDSLLSYYHVFEGYKQDKADAHSRFSFKSFLKEMDPNVLKKIHQILGEKQKNLQKESLEKGGG